MNISTPDALPALDGPFAVADLETTGLDSEHDRIMEIAAIRTGPFGTSSPPVYTFNQLARTGPNVVIPENIIEMTGITQALIEQSGRHIYGVLKDFIQFIGSHPVFFHNADFDKRFIRQAIRRADILGQAPLIFDNTVYDSIEVAKYAWPELSSYSLEHLAKHVGARKPEHRALSDVKTTYSVLSAAKKIIYSKSGNNFSKYY